jgi:hypothetical protein
MYSDALIHPCHNKLRVTLTLEHKTFSFNNSMPSHVLLYTALCTVYSHLFKH